MLGDMLNYRNFPEIGKPLWNRDREGFADKVLTGFAERRIVKAHEIPPQDIHEEFLPRSGDGEVRVFSVVRNPRDRLISLALHHLYRNYGAYEGLTEDQAILHCYNSDEYKEGTQRIFDTMLLENHVLSNPKGWCWISYEELNHDETWVPLRSLYALTNFLGHNVSIETIAEFRGKHSFAAKAGRRQGEEVASDTWRRKGINNDYKNRLTGDLEFIIDETQDIHNLYYNRFGLALNTPTKA